MRPAHRRDDPARRLRRVEYRAAKSVYAWSGPRYGGACRRSRHPYNWSLPAWQPGVFRAHPQFRRTLRAAAAVRRSRRCVRASSRREHGLQDAVGICALPAARDSLRMGGWLPERGPGDAGRQLQQHGQLHASLHEALTRPTGYEKIGIRNLAANTTAATSLLQIENEFYGTIRPSARSAAASGPARFARARRRVHRGSLHGLDPSCGGHRAARCVFSTSSCCTACSPTAPDTPAEIAALGRTSSATASQAPAGCGWSVTARRCCSRLGGRTAAAVCADRRALDGVHGGSATPAWWRPRKPASPKRAPCLRPACCRPCSATWRQLHRLHPRQAEQTRNHLLALP